MGYSTINAGIAYEPWRSLYIKAKKFSATTPLSYYII